MSNVNWGEVTSTTPKSGREDAKTRQMMEGALRRFDLSASDISKAVGAKESTAVSVVNQTRKVAEMLVGFGTFTMNGKQYALSLVQSPPELVKKTA